MTQPRFEHQPPNHDAPFMTLAAQISADSLSRTIAISNHGDGMASTAVTGPDGNMVRVERKGSSYSLQPLDQHNNPIQSHHVSTAPKIDVDA